MCYNCKHDRVERLQELEENKRNFHGYLHSFIESYDLINKILNYIYTTSPNGFIRFDNLQPGWNIAPDCDEIRELLKEELKRFLPASHIQITVQDLSLGYFIQNDGSIRVKDCRFNIFLSYSNCFLHESQKR